MNTATLIAVLVNCAQLMFLPAHCDLARVTVLQSANDTSILALPKGRPHKRGSMMQSTRSKLVLTVTV